MGFISVWAVSFLSTSLKISRRLPPTTDTLRLQDNTDSATFGGHVSGNVSAFPLFPLFINGKNALSFPNTQPPLN